MQAQDNVDNAVLHISRASSMATHFENLFQSALNLGQRYRTLKKIEVRCEGTSTDFIIETLYAL